MISQKIKFFILFLLISFCIASPKFSFSQDQDFEIILDAKANTQPLAGIFKPNIDLSGRGFHRELSWPQTLAASELLDQWQKDIGFKGFYRIQYNLWEINEVNKLYNIQRKLFSNYEDIFKKITDAGGVVILDIFGTPAGLGKVLDKKSAPLDLKAFKELIKDYMRELSCKKKYNIWYEVWTAVDLDDFFLGRKQDYFGMYRAVAEAAKELQFETGIKIPVGGPGSSWWFQNIEGNTIVTPERSLIYELIKYCYHYHLPLDFISWHAYSTDPKAESDLTRYKNTSVQLIRDWLSYFSYSRETPLIIDEWNYDSGANLLPARAERANVGASFIISRLKNMFEAGIDQQLYFCLEDFQNNREGVVRNTGVFSYNSESSEYKGSPKCIYNAFKMLSMLGSNMYLLPGLKDDFTGAIATKNNEEIKIIFYNYVDPYFARSYLSRRIATFADSERRVILNMIKNNTLDNVLSSQQTVAKLRTTKRLKSLLKKVQVLNAQAEVLKNSDRNIKLQIKNLSGDYTLEKYILDSECVMDCKFNPVEKKDISAAVLDEVLQMKPYSVSMVVLKKKPQEEPLASEVKQPRPQTAEQKPVSEQKPADEKKSN